MKKKKGVIGKLYRCIRSMYRTVKARVRCGAHFTECINCTRDVKQGDVYSPVLFSQYINELALEFINNGNHGVTYSSFFFCDIVYPIICGQYYPVI